MKGTCLNDFWCRPSHLTHFVTFLAAATRRHRRPSCDLMTMRTICLHEIRWPFLYCKVAVFLFSSCSQWGAPASWCFFHIPPLLQWLILHRIMRPFKHRFKQLWILAPLGESDLLGALRCSNKGYLLEHDTKGARRCSCKVYLLLIRYWMLPSFIILSLYCQFAAWIDFSNAISLAPLVCAQ